MAGKPRVREAILDAAEAVVMAAGAAHLTLERWPTAPGEQGGLLYNFPTKDALVEGMIARCVQRFEANSQMPDPACRRALREISAPLWLPSWTTPGWRRR